MMRRLKAKGIWNKALVIVLADHGVSFRHQQPRRLPTPGNMEDIAFVPLFVKLPHQQRGRIDDGLARTVDVVPTIARYLHLKIPYHVDGRPLIGRRLPRDGTVSLLIGNGKYATARLSDLQALRRQALAEQLATFGTTPADLYRVGPHQELLGRLVSGLLTHPSRSTSVQLSNESLLRTVDTRSGLLPTWIQGDVSGPLDSQDLAIAVNGRIAAVTQPFDVGGVMVFVDGEQVYASKASLIQPKSMLGQVSKQNPYGFEFDLPASLLPKPGSGHRVRVFAVRGGAAGELRYLGAWPWGH